MDALVALGKFINRDSLPVSAQQLAMSRFDGCKQETKCKIQQALTNMKMKGNDFGMESQGTAMPIREQVQEKLPQQQMSTFKVVYNNDCYGGFSISSVAEALLKNTTEWEECEGRSYRVKRDDPEFVAVVEKLGNVAAGKHAKLELPLRFKNCWYIDEYDGLEHIQVNVEEYRLDKIRAVLHCSKQHGSCPARILSEKVAAIGTILDEEVDW